MRQYYIINVINHIQNPRFKIYTILYLSLIIYLCHVSKLQIFNPLNKPNTKLLEYLSTINTISQIVFDLSVNIFNPLGLDYRSTNEYSRLNPPPSNLSILHIRNRIELKSIFPLKLSYRPFTR